MKNEAHVKFTLLFSVVLIGSLFFSPLLLANEEEQVEVTVTTAAGPAQGVKVYVFSGDSAYMGLYGETGADGKVSFELSVGQAYKFRADLMSNQYWSDVITVQGGTTNHVLVDAGGGNLQVTVEKAAGIAMEGINTYLFNASGTYLGFSQVTDSAGKVIFSVPEGDYKLRADYLGYHFWSNNTTVTEDTDIILSIAHQDVVITVEGLYQGSSDPKEGTNVYLFTPAGTYMGRNQVTDSSGQVTFNLPQQPYTVRADYLGQQFWSEAFIGQDITVSIPMAHAEVTVTGSGQPLEGITVYVFTGAGSYLGMHGSTDATGKLTLELPSGPYKFRADYQGSQYWSGEETLLADLVNQVAISTGGGTFTLTVQKGASNPLADINCYVFSEGGSYLGMSAKTDANGQVAFALADGTYRFRVDYLGYQFWTQVYEVPTILSDEYIIQHQDVAVRVEGMYQGTDDPLEGINVYLFTSTGTYMSLNQVTDNNGRVVFNLPEQPYKIRADYLGRQFWSDAFTGLDITVAIPMADAEITVTGNGQPLEDENVYVFTTTGSYLGINGQTALDGKIIFRLPAGSYKFRVDYQGSQYWSEEETLIADQINQISVSTGGGTFLLTVQKGTNDPLVDVNCYVFSESGAYLGVNGNTDADGQVAYALADGNYKFRVDYLGYQFWTQVFQVPTTLASEFTLAHQNVVITVQGMYQVAESLQGIRVYLFTSSGSYMSQNQITDINGQVTFNLPEQPYKVRADYLGRQFWSDTFTWQDTSITIREGMAQPHVLRGEADVEGARVYLFSNGGSYLGRYDTTDESGMAEFIIPEGSYMFRADEGGDQCWSPVTFINAGQVTGIELQLSDLPPTVTVSADPDHIALGESSALTWSTTNAETVTIDQGIGSVELSGTTVVSPLDTTVYTISATGPGGTVTDSVEVQVRTVPEDVEYGLNYDEQEGGGGLVGETIRILNGNVVEYRSDLTFFSPNSLGLSFSASYNSKSETLCALGFGWIHSYAMDLDPSYLIGGTNYIRVINQTGRAAYFVEDTPGKYRGAFNEKSRIEYDNNEYIWCRLDGSRYGFSDSGKLIWVEDEKQNRLTVSFDAQNRPGTVTDFASGRTLSFNYNANGLMETIAGPITTAVPTGIWVTYGYDGDNNLTSVTYADGSGFTYAYDDPVDEHNLTEKRNNEGHFLNTWSYDTLDRCVDNFSVNGNGVSIDYVSDVQVDVTDGYGTLRTYTIQGVADRKRLTEIQGPSWSPYSNSNAVRWAYDSQMRLVEVEYAGGTINQYQNHDERGNPGTVILAVGTSEQRTINLTYHPDMNAPLTRTEASVLSEGNKVTTWDYDEDGNTIPNEAPTKLLNRVIEQGNTKDINGNVVPYTYITAFTYNTKGQITSIDGPRPEAADTISFTYDPITGDLLSNIKPYIGNTVFSNYDAAGFVGNVTDVNNHQKSYTYDAKGRITSIINHVDSSTSSNTYTPAGLPWVSTDEDGVTRTSSYDANYGRLERVTDHEGNYIAYVYDLQGNQIEMAKYDQSDTQAFVKRWDYNHPDLPGKLWREIDADNKFTEYVYDDPGNIQSVTDPSNNTTSYTYDPLNRLSTVTQPGNAVTSYGYDSHGNLISLIDAENHETTYQYDDMGRMVSTTSPDTGTVTHVYDEAGNPVRKTDANGTSVAYVYDFLNRLVEIDFPTDTDITYTYDQGTNGAGHRTHMADASGTTAFYFDDRDRLFEKTTTSDNYSYTVSRNFTPANRVSSITYPSGRTVDYHRTGGCMCRINKVSTNFDGTTVTLIDNLAYRPFGSAKTMDTGGGGHVENDIDLNGHITTGNPGSYLEKIYGYDDNGNLSSIQGTNTPWLSQDFTYDEANRLLFAQGSYGTFAYSYDKVGNRLTRTGTVNNVPVIDETYAYIPGTNMLDEITGTNPVSFTYDSNGNTTGMDARTFTYNENNRLVQVEEDGELLAEYTYNALGQRVTKKVPGMPLTIFLYDFEGNLIAEGKRYLLPMDEYLYMGNTVLAKVNGWGAKIYNYHNNSLGTPQMLTNSENKIVWEGIYKPFGDAEVNAASTEENNLRFPGQYFDSETGLHYNYHRYYDPRMGRYLRPDPIGLNGGINIFTFTSNNPINLTDFYGLLDAMDSYNYFNKGVVPKGFPPGYSPANYNLEDMSLGRGLSFEGHLIKGGGLDTFYCCDSSSNKWRVRTKKKCMGFAAIVSGGASFQLLDKKDCPDGYAGEYIEFGVGQLEFSSPSFQSEATSGCGFGISGGLGAKLTVCKYTIIDKEIIDCCD